MALPPQFLEELRSRLSVSEVVMKRMRLQRAGREFKAPCPFHNEKTPSFYVNDQKNFFHCFGCGAHGDQIGFVMRHDNLSFMEAVEHLAGEAGLQVPQASPQERQQYERQKSLYDLVERATKYYERELFSPSGRNALDYLRRRGLDDEGIARFRLGYAPQEGGPLRALLLEAGYSEADMVEVGLFKRAEPGRPLRNFFWNRVMFPVTDRRGQVVAFGGRILEGDGPKYINSAENPLFHKGNLLYGMSRARQAAADGQRLIVTEGYMDVISCVQAGFAGAVAPLGTAMTETQIQVLWKLAPEGQRNPILCFDGDNAGRRAAQRAVDRVLPILVPDATVRIAFMPDKEDPDSLIRTGGPDAFSTILDRALSLEDFIWEMVRQGEDPKTADGRLRIETGINQMMEKVADKSVQYSYRSVLREKLRAAIRAGGGGFSGAGGDRGGARSRRLQPGDIPVSPKWDSRFSGVRTSGTLRTDPRRRERYLLLAIVHHPELFQDVGETLAGAEFADDEMDALRQAIVACLTAESALDAEALRRHLSGRGFSETLDSLLSADMPKFAQPGASFETAKSGWQEVWLSSEDGLLQRELRDAERRFAETFSEDDLARLRALQRELLILRGHADGLMERDG
ncbi:DNA primase [Niveispirillum lacus]|uniref:DNA primase n=1 Tax=Niveispirillum lacus TaxID=1981099 RepID=A0A255YVY3_9PROT|nr:DNA primase [Niveispirillum lacus]OYQ32580.1 DNA primase [Niveispirillum lacus]